MYLSSIAQWYDKWIRRTSRCCTTTQLSEDSSIVTMVTNPSDITGCCVLVTKCPSDL